MSLRSAVALSDRRICRVDPGKHGLCSHHSIAPGPPGRVFRVSPGTLLAPVGHRSRGHRRAVPPGQPNLPGGGGGWRPGHGGLPAATTTTRAETTKHWFLMIIIKFLVQRLQRRLWIPRQQPSGRLRWRKSAKVWRGGPAIPAAPGVPPGGPGPDPDQRPGRPGSLVAGIHGPVEHWVPGPSLKNSEPASLAGLSHLGNFEITLRDSDRGHQQSWGPYISEMCKIWTSAYFAYFFCTAHVRAASISPRPSFVNHTLLVACQSRLNKSWAGGRAVWTATARRSAGRTDSVAYRTPGPGDRYITLRLGE